MNIFTYGPLMFDQVWSRVVTGSYERTVARLSGFRRRLLSGRVYPALIPGGVKDVVDGVVYLDVQEADVMELDRLEGELYRREAVRCEIPGPASLPAETFLLREIHLHLSIDRDWDQDLFARTGLPLF